MDISVIIVNYNTTEFLEGCLKSTIEKTNGVKYEIIVVDNNSPDRDIERFPRKFPAIDFYFRDINDGFGAGCNYGAGKARGKYLVFVNPDTIIKDNVLKKLFDYMENNPDVGMCSGGMFDFDGNLMITISVYPNWYTEFLDAIGRGTNRRLTSYLKSKQMKKGEPFEVDWIMGAYMFFRKKCFDLVGGFDEDFFLYMEDTEIQFRIRQAGYKIVCLPAVKIFHFKNSTIQSIDHDIFQYNTHRSKMIYFYKHFGFLKRNMMRTMFIIGFLSRMLLLIFRRSFKERRQQKLRQYIMILSLYTSRKFKLELK